ncbi:MAG: CPBP family intramembrane metalloprotease [Myxococcales bacterium]|nr:CPBP family intramembrane metalloprotease [Myxococcales bacterium]
MLHPPTLTRRQLLWASVLVEGPLLVLAVGLGALFEVPWWNKPVTVEGCLVGSALGALLGGAVVGLAHLQGAFLGRLQADFKLVTRVVAPLNRTTDLCLISLLAGVTEEALFRGLLLDWLRAPVGDSAALALTSIVFGLLHPLSLPYVAYASGLGLVFGLLVVREGEIAAAMLAHAAFDAVALLGAVRSRTLRADG